MFHVKFIFLILYDYFSNILYLHINIFGSNKNVKLYIFQIDVKCSFSISYIVYLLFYCIFTYLTIFFYIKL